MAQMKVFSWTNPSSGTAARLQDIGFEVSEILLTNQTSGGQFYWNSEMTDGYYITQSSGTVTTSNGFTPLAQSATYGATVSAFTNANPGVLTVNDTAIFGFAKGDTIRVEEIADDLTGTLSLNGEYVIASLTATTITTATNTSVTGYSVWVSGGRVTRVKDINNVPIPTENIAIRGMTLGTGVVGSNDDYVTGVARGQNSVT